MAMKHITLGLLLTAGIATALLGADGPVNRKASILAARQIFDSHQEQLRVATAKLQEDALNRSEQLGRWAQLLIATEEELALRNAELERFRQKPGNDAFRLALDCQRRIDTLLEAKAELGRRHAEAERGHLDALVKQAQQPATLGGESHGDALLVRLTAILDRGKTPTADEDAMPSPSDRTHTAIQTSPKKARADRCR